GVERAQDGRRGRGARRGDRGQRLPLVGDRLHPKRAGGGKNALMAILALPDTKHALVVDEDVDIFDPTQVEWARTFRVQADRDVIVIAGAQGKHVDPSVRPWELEHGQLPMTAKMGIDATIPEGIPPAFYERIKHVWVDDVTPDDYE